MVIRKLRALRCDRFGVCKDKLRGGGDELVSHRITGGGIDLIRVDDLSPSAGRASSTLFDFHLGSAHLEDPVLLGRSIRPT